MTSYSTADVAEFQAEMGTYGVSIKATDSLKLLRHVGDKSLCIDALLMTNRPEWLTALVGPK